MRKYGEHGDAVAAFLTEVAHQDLTTWQELSLEPLGTTEATVEATHAITKLRLPAAARTSVVNAAAKAYVNLDLDPADFPGLFRRSNIRGGIESAAVAIAAGDQLDAAHRETLLRPFADAGFTSAAEALDQH